MKKIIQPEQSIAADPERAALRPYPARLFAEVTTRCNLRCRMCSKQSPGSGIVDGDMSDETFARLIPSFPQLDALILNGIGEPLLHPRLERFIEIARREMPDSASIGFQTNGQLLGRERALSIVKAGADRICVSSDAVSPEIFRMMRNGGEQKAVGTGVSALNEAARKYGRKISVGLEFVATRDNVDELPQLLRWATQNNAGFMIVTHMLPYHEQMNKSAAFDTNTDRALNLFLEWKLKAAADGVDISRYFEVFMRFSKNPEEAKIVDYVKQMTAEALSKGIELNMEKLVRYDEMLMQHIKEVFDESAAIAKSAGIELQLPGLVPERTRRCEFVEEGSAFVSWDGNVHPCYFLWHRYNCDIGGVVKYVKPESFGNLLEKGILEIWNGPDFRKFREGVLKYDFPFCYDCNVALCDLVQVEDFTQDCHINTVPCGACLWCTGLFRCLQ